MSATVLNAADLSAETPKAAAPMNARTLMLLSAPIVPTLLSLAWPNVLVMLAQASTGLIETWWVSRLGTDALTGMAPARSGQAAGRTRTRSFCMRF